MRRVRIQRRHVAQLNVAGRRYQAVASLLTVLSSGSRGPVASSAWRRSFLLERCPSSLRLMEQVMPIVDAPQMSFRESFPARTSRLIQIGECSMPASSISHC